MAKDPGKACDATDLCEGDGRQRGANEQQFSAALPESEEGRMLGCGGLLISLIVVGIRVFDWPLSPWPAASDVSRADAGGELSRKSRPSLSAQVLNATRLGDRIS
jgi:hypothetical protein